MKRAFNILYIFILISLMGCNDFLDKSPMDKIDGEAMFSDPEGVKVYMANLYYQLPIEDFTYFREGFNFNPSDPNNGGFAPAMTTDEAAHSGWSDLVRDWDFTWWEPAFELIRDINILSDEIPNLSVSELEEKQLSGEVAFLRAYAYYALAKRYGGVPIIDEHQVYEGDVEALKIPRSTEKETWDFVLDQCDIASENLPSSWSEGQRRGTKWAALALKSRAALHAASVAKYWNEAPLSGNAVSQGLVGIEENEANRYYEICIKASEEIINSDEFDLFMPDPSSPNEAAANYQKLFENPNNALVEAIFIKGYAIPGTKTGHNYDIWYVPNQLSNGWPHPGRMNPTLELVDSYEHYSQPGESYPIVTTQDGDIDDYSGFDPNKNYLRFNNPSKIFEGKDARLGATSILPGTSFKETNIIIQAGLVLPDGSTIIETKDSYSHNEKTYHTFGAPDWTQYSGFDTYGENMTRTGFTLKKFLNSKDPVIPSWNQSTTDWIEFRYAEILLNYAEAVIEGNYSGNNAVTNAKNYLNSIRRRAGHTTDIPLTLENVLRERKIELVFENKRYWDLVRRREYHKKFDNTTKHALFPLLDLRVNPPQYIFVRKELSRHGKLTFLPKQYYKPIPGIGSNELVQNPQY